MTQKTPTTAASNRFSLRAAIPAACLVVLLSGCGGNDSAPSVLPQLAAAQAGTLANCASLTGFVFANTTIASAASVAASAVTSNADGVALPLPAHCVVVGKMNPRTGIDGKSYAINFEMRLPTNWNGRFFHQVNGGNDGFINTDTTRAFGRKLGGSPTSNGLIDGFAVLTSDAGPPRTRPRTRATPPRAWASPARYSASILRPARTMATLRSAP
jgi:feruloyl esterase